MLHCPCVSAKKARDTALDALGADLEDCGSHLDIVSLLLLTVETDKEPPADVRRELREDFTKILDTQLEIGWKLVKYGFLSTTWREIQHEWASQRDPHYNSNKTEWWARRVQVALWKYVLAVWEHQNNVVHGKTKEEINQKRLARLRQQVKSILQTPPALGRHGHLLTINDVDDRRGQFLHHWIRAVKAATEQERLRQAKEARHSITNYMMEVRRQQQEQPS